MPDAVRIGTPLRDAAVEPRPGDYLVACNAGRPGRLGNPHGPSVVHPPLVDDFPTPAAHRRYLAGLYGERFESEDP